MASVGSSSGEVLVSNALGVRSICVLCSMVNFCTSRWNLQETVINSHRTAVQTAVYKQLSETAFGTIVLTAVQTAVPKTAKTVV